MGVTFALDHHIDLQNHAGWLWYSWDGNNPPQDRQVVQGDSIIRPPSVSRMADWFFLSDLALIIINPSRYLLTPVLYGEWRLWIEDPARAALFKLRFM